MFERCHERALIMELFVPPAITGREQRAHVHFVHRGVELHPGITLREGRRVFGKQLREVRILKISNPVGHAKVAEIRDRNDLTAAKIRENCIGEGPVVTPRAEEGFVQWWAVTKKLDPQLLCFVEVLTPAFVMAAAFQLIYANPSLVDGRIAVLDSGRKSYSRPFGARIAHNVYSLISSSHLLC